MRKTFVIIQLAVLFLVFTGVVVFHYTLGLSWSSSVYFVITTMTTVGYGDIYLADAPVGVKFFGNFLMLGGAASLAAIFGMITDYLLRSHFDRVFGLRRKKMRGHTILCGLGNVGIRILEHLHKLGEQVTVVEKAEEGRFIDMTRDLKVPIVRGDMRLVSFLEKAGLKHAKALIAASEDDLANLEAALNARSARPDIRVVLRVFDTNLAEKLEGIFGTKTVFSTSALSAPGFALAAIDPEVVGSFYVDDALMTNVEVVIAKDSSMDGMTTDELRSLGELSILSHISASTGEKRLHPSSTITLGKGDRLVVSMTQDFYDKFKELNKA
ncbi:potassium channel family protein [Candidatus Hydrogenedentota bacterium]